MPEIDPALADVWSQRTRRPAGVEMRTNALVRAIEPCKVHLANETIAADTIVLAAASFRIQW